MIQLKLIGLFLLLFSFGCDVGEKFFPPDLPEKLCTICIIDADGIVKKFFIISRTFQDSIVDQNNDSIRDLSISLSNENHNIFHHEFTAVASKKAFEVSIPDSVQFDTDSIYSFSAKEKNFPEIFAEVSLPDRPPSLIVSSSEKLILPNPTYGFQFSDHEKEIQLAVLNLYFYQKDSQSRYYTLLVDGIGIRSDILQYYPELNVPDLIDYTVLQSNAEGFSEIILNTKTHRHYQDGIRTKIESAPIKAYFFDSSSLPGDTCILKLGIQVSTSQNSPVFDYKKPIHIRLLSVPKELYNFEKNLYTYNTRHNDPFSEPVYIEGNIKHGLGIFAICRSSEITTILPSEGVLY